MVTQEIFNRWVSRAPHLKLHYLSYIGKVEEHGYLRFTWDEYLRMHIELTDEGYEWLMSEYDVHGTHNNDVYKGCDGVWGLWIDKEWNYLHPIMDVQYELFEDIQANSEWTYSQIDNSPYLHTCGIDDNGQIDTRSGDMTWDFTDYVFSFWLEDIILKGEAIFKPFYTYDRGVFMDWTAI